MKTLVIGFFSYIAVAMSGFANYTINLPFNQQTPIANALNNASTVSSLFPNPGGALDGDQILFWNCSGSGYTCYLFDSSSGTGFSDCGSFSPVTPPLLLPGGGAFFVNNTTSPFYTWTVTGTPVTPFLPPTNYCGCGKLSLLSLQNTNFPGTFQNITGFAPQEGAQEQIWNGTGFNVFTFTGGAWSPSNPPALPIGVSAFFLVPCITNCITMTCFTNKTVPCGTNWNFDAPTNIIDNCCTNFSLTFTTVTNNSGPCPLVVTRTWLVSDICGHSNTCSQTVTVTSATVFTCPTNKAIACTNNLVFNLPTATNACCGTNVSINIFGSDVTTNTGPCAYTITRTWRITDCCNTNFCSQTITVTNLPLFITCPTNKTISCTNTLVFNLPTATNACCGTNVSITVFGSDVTTNTGPCAYSIKRTWRITDCCNTNFCSQTITVTSTPPVIICPAPKTIPCNSNVVFNLPVVVSACCSNFSIITTVGNDVTNHPGPCTNVITRTWRIVDCCNNTNFCSQTITVTHPKPFLFGISSKTNLCGVPLTWNTPTAADPCCGTNLHVGILSTVTNSFNPLVVVRTWVATNCCGLTNTFSETVTLLQNAPANDYCTNAIQVFANTSICGTTRCATPSDPATLFPAPCGSSSAAPDVWYKFTAQCGGKVIFNTCGTNNCTGQPVLDTVLSVYTGQCGQLIQVPGTNGCNDDFCGQQSQVTVTNVVACTTYYIRVAEPLTVSPGDFVLNVIQTFTAPANDLCANATAVGNGTFPFQNCGANTDGPLNPTNCTTFNDVWFTYTAPCSGQMWIETCKSCFNTTLSVYSGVCTNLTLIKCNQQATNGNCAGGVNSFVSFAATAGQTYRIRVGSVVLNATGGGFLTVNGPYPAAGTCPPATGSMTYRNFNVQGTANNTAWAWSIQSACCANIGTNAPGVHVGGTAAELATNFINSINGVGCPGIHATKVGLPGSGWFQVCVTVCSNAPLGFVLRVGAVNTLDQNQCVVTGPALPTSGPCSFNPDIFELPVSGQDLNGNGVDDAIDILSGTSLDVDQNGVPDEVQSCLPPVLTTKPVSQVIQLGNSVTLSSAATGTPTLTYRWSRAGVPLSDNANVSGSSSNVLTILSVGSTNLGDYDIAVSNSCSVVHSAPATLSIQTITAPVIVNATASGGTFQFTFQTQTGVNYVIEYTDDLSAPTWVPLEIVEGDGDLRQAVDPLPDLAVRFYRVRVN